MKNDLSLHKVLINKRVQGWVRPADWLPMPDIPAGEQKVVMLVGIHSDVPDMPQMMSANGNYTVDWGDGSAPQDVSGGSICGHLYNYAALPQNTLCSRGYKQVFITVVPSGASNLTGITLRNTHNMHFAVLDISIRGQYLTSITLQAYKYLERFRFFGPANLTSRLTFSNAPLGEVFFEDPRFTVIDYMFRSSGIKKIDINLAGKTLTNAEYMAENCYRLESVNLHGASISGSCRSAFYNCNFLGEVVGINVENATNLLSMFYSCYILRRANITGIALNISFADCLLHRPELVEIFNNLKTVSGQTITITNNPGAAALTAAERAIATDKGWTITG